jgi:hypothetical protein
MSNFKLFVKGHVVHGLKNNPLKAKREVPQLYGLFIFLDNFFETCVKCFRTFGKLHKQN